jgi:release factor glutamine methyltransferase
VDEFYRPAEDSMLLLRYVIRLVEGSVLDMGTGSGVLAVEAALKPGVTKVLAVDINPAAIEETRRRATEQGVSNKISFKVGDLFEGITERFDWIIFNPPYLPEEGAEDPSWEGGPKGTEITERFLRDAASRLKKDGSVLLVYSNLTGLHPSEYVEYDWEVLEEMPLFFEKLYCARLRPVSPT